MKFLGGLLALWLVVLAAASIWFGLTHKGHHMHDWMEGPANATAPVNAAATNTAP